MVSTTSSVPNKSAPPHSPHAPPPPSPNPKAKENWASGPGLQDQCRKYTQIRPTLHYEAGLKKLGANFEHFWLVVWYQVTNKCQNIDVRVLLNARTLAPRVTNWLPKFDGILFFSALGPIQGRKVQHLVLTGGRLKRFFFLFKPSLLVESHWG